MSCNILLYGATGFSGRLIASHAKQLIAARERRKPSGGSFWQLVTELNCGRSPAKTQWSFVPSRSTTIGGSVTAWMGST